MSPESMGTSKMLTASTRRFEFSLPDKPRVTIILPIRNEEAFIHSTLMAVLRQDWPDELVEVLIVDGMSDDGTRQIVKQVMNECPQRDIQIIDNPARIVPTGMNRALAKATGQVVIRVDGHCEIAPVHVRKCITLLHETGAANVGGRARPVGNGIVAEAIAKATCSPFGVGGSRFRYSTRAGWANTVFPGAWPHEVFDKIGGFDEELVRNQDDELNFRIRQHGGKIWFDPSLEILYYNRSTFHKLWDQYYQYGLYKVRVIQKRKAVSSWRHLVPSLFVVALSISFIMALATGQPVWSLLIVGPYVAASGLASILAARGNLFTLPFLPIAFSILHISYGIGFVHGLWKWRRHWYRDEDAADTL